MLNIFASGCKACDYRQASPGAVRGGSNKQQPAGSETGGGDSLGDGVDRLRRGVEQQALLGWTRKR